MADYTVLSSEEREIIRQLLNTYLDKLVGAYSATMFMNLQRFTGEQCDTFAKKVKHIANKTIELDYLKSSLHRGVADEADLEIWNKMKEDFLCHPNYKK